MKKLIFIIIYLFLLASKAEAQIKETAQLATLTPMLLVVSDDNIENYKKLHYTVSTVSYLGFYLITDSIWKSAAGTLLLGVTKELIHDGLLKRGDPLLVDMAWNTLGVAQGVVFTVSLKF